MLRITVHLFVQSALVTRVRRFYNVNIPCTGSHGNAVMQSKLAEEHYSILYTVQKMLFDNVVRQLLKYIAKNMKDNYLHLSLIGLF